MNPSTRFRIVVPLVLTVLAIACMAPQPALAVTPPAVPAVATPAPAFAVHSFAASTVSPVATVVQDSAVVGFGRLADSLRLTQLVSRTSIDSLAFTIDSIPWSRSRNSAPPSSLPLAPLGLGIPLLGFAGALTKERDTLMRSGGRRAYPVAAATKIYQGSLVMLDAGNAKPGAAAVSKIALGRACATVDNSAGAAGDLQVEVEVGEFLWANSAAADLIAGTEVGTDCYIVDDQTVAKTNGSSSRSRAGKVTGVDARGVWVLVGIPF